MVTIMSINSMRRKWGDLVFWAIPNFGSIVVAVTRTGGFEITAISSGSMIRLNNVNRFKWINSVDL